ncbi:hypothetical protein [Marinobacter sp. SS5-14b]|uniref:hypothetical protein n=1 Tax=Marinobacter sp. SS5-14b TaxID=3050456 RepID=UPI0026DF51C2|nr:hypothetical protein [Marinobacter sp. SS5-14b]
MEGLIFLVVIAVIVYAFVKGNASKSTKPNAGDPYACSGCGVQVKHSRRTISAWERGARSFYCKSCHGKWREVQSSQKPSGCLGMFVFIVVFPAIAITGLFII